MLRFSAANFLRHRQYRDRQLWNSQHFRRSNIVLCNTDNNNAVSSIQQAQPTKRQRNPAKRLPILNQICITPRSSSGGARYVSSPTSSFYAVWKNILDSTTVFGVACNQLRLHSLRKPNHGQLHQQSRK